VQKMADDKKDDIHARAAALRDAEGVTNQADHLLHYMRARKEIADGLTQEQIVGYQALATKETKQRRQPPTPHMIFE
jgi:hypothetical protein